MKAIVVGALCNILVLIVVETAQEGDVRLMDGKDTLGRPDDTQGRVEVFKDGQWGTVTDDLWGNEDARVVCKQLGFTDTLQSVGHNGGTYPSGVDPIHLDNVQCKGYENNLLECPYSTYYIMYDTHAEDAGVSCAVPGSDGCLADPPCKILEENCIYKVHEIVRVAHRRCPICRCASCPKEPKCPQNCRSLKTELYQGKYCQQCRCVEYVTEPPEEVNSISVGVMAGVSGVFIVIPGIALIIAICYKRKLAASKARAAKASKGDKGTGAGGVTVA